MKKTIILILIILSTNIYSQNIITADDTNSGYIIPKLYNTHNIFIGPYPRNDLRRGNNFPAQPYGTKLYGIACLLSGEIPDSVDYYAFFLRDNEECTFIDSIRVNDCIPTTFLSVNYSSYDSLLPMYEVYFDSGYRIDESRFSVAIGHTADYIKHNDRPMCYERHCPMIRVSDNDTINEFWFSATQLCNINYYGTEFFGAIPIIDSSLRIQHELMLTCGDIGALHADYTDVRVHSLHWSDTNQHCLYQLAFGPASQTPENYTVVETTDTVYQHAGINFGEPFAFRVRAKCCFNDSISIWRPWSDTIHFRRPFFNLDARPNNPDWGYVLGGGPHEQNAYATVTAVPRNNCDFIQWNDGDTNNPRTITLISDTTLTAIFEYRDTSSHNTPITTPAEGNSITVTPNPTAATVRITAQERIQHVELYDLQGRSVLSRIASENSIELNLASLPAGTYTAAILTEHGLYARKIIKR